MIVDANDDSDDDGDGTVRRRGGDGAGAGRRGLQPGDAAPAFSLPGSDGATHTLADFAGKKAVVLAWFPKAFTGG